VAPALTDPKAASIIIETATVVAARLKQQFNLPLSIIIIDTIIAAAGYRREGADNDSATSHLVMSTLAQISRGVSCFVVGLDHYGKDTSAGTRGSSVKEGDADVILACLGDRNETGHVSNSRLALRKRRSGPSGEDCQFKPRGVNMGLDQKTGKPITTLVIDWTESGDKEALADKATGKEESWGRGKAIKLLRRIIMILLVDAGEQIMPFANGPQVRALKIRLSSRVL
jgi:hypothetical protein